MSPHLLRQTDIGDLPEHRSQHQFNDNAIRHSRNLGKTAGLQRLGVHLVRLEKGHDSTTHHFHDADEEFLYILSGRGTARIGDDTFEVAAGDFMGFPAPSPAHSLHNPHDEDLVYLMGGEGWPVDIVHYPDIQHTMIKAHGKRSFARTTDFKDLPPKP